MNDFPILKVSLENVQYHVVHAFGNAMDDIKKYAQDAINASMNTLREGGLERAIVASVERTMREAIGKGIEHAVQEAVDEYFSEGNGQQFIAEEIVSYLKKKK